MDESETISAESDPAQNLEIEPAAVQEAAAEQEKKEEEKIPLSTLIKERKKKQEAELRAIELEQRVKLMEEGFHKKSEDPADDFNDEDEELLTVGAAKKRDQQLIARVTRETEEKHWVKNNQDKLEIINEKLPSFLKEKPHFATSLEQSVNRYEDAWYLISSYYGLNTQEKKTQGKIQDPPKINAPSSPAGTPKGAGLNQGVDLMKMSDADYEKWVEAKLKRR